MLPVGCIWLHCGGLRTVHATRTENEQQRTTKCKLMAGFRMDWGRKSTRELFFVQRERSSDAVSRGFQAFRSSVRMSYRTIDDDDDATNVVTNLLLICTIFFFLVTILLLSALKNQRTGNVSIFKF